MDESHVKALFLYNFAKFVEWPLDMPGDAISIAVIANDAFADVLDQTVAGKKVNGRGFVVRPVKPEEQGQQCQIAFVAASEKKYLRSILERFKGSAVLTAGVPVLIVDDNASSRSYLDSVLRRWNMRSVLAPSASDAWGLLQQAHGSERPFRLVLTDMNVPGMDGMALAQQIRDGGDASQPAILFLTSNARKGEAARAPVMGAAYLSKPVRASELLVAIQKALHPTQDAGPQNGMSAPHTSGRLPVRALRILLAEDNRVNQILAVRLLERRGCQVQVASNGREVLSRLETEEYDAILMDGQMPFMTGFEATQAIRRQEKETGRHIPIIAMTAHAMKGDRERCLTCGMDDYIAKPVNPMELYDVLERLRVRLAALSPVEAEPA